MLNGHTPSTPAAFCVMTPNMDVARETIPVLRMSEVKCVGDTMVESVKYRPRLAKTRSKGLREASPLYSMVIR